MIHWKFVFSILLLYNINEEKAREIFTAAGYNVDKMWITRSYDGNNVDIKWLNVLANKKK